MTEFFTLGWREWAKLPELGLPAIKAKVDTGAKTSALHAVDIVPFGPPESLQVRFTTRPDPDNPGSEFACAARVVDRRSVTSSNGKAELRYVIGTLVRIGDKAWPIQITLTNRHHMKYRMLLGRQAIRAGVLIDPNKSFVQPVPEADDGQDAASFTH